MSRSTELALTAARAARDEDLKETAERAMEELASLITGLARRVCGRQGSVRLQDARDFVEGAAAHVWAKLPKFERWYFTKLSGEARADDGADYFTAWCRRVLQNHWKDSGRRGARRGKPQELMGDESRDLRREPPDESDAMQLSPDQVERVRRWDPVDGVIAFGLSGSWSLLPPMLSRQWLETLGMAGSFPTELLSAPRGQRRELLAAALRMRRNTLDKRWSRFASATGSAAASRAPCAGAHAKARPHRDAARRCIWHQSI